MDPMDTMITMEMTMKIAASILLMMNEDETYKDDTDTEIEKETEKVETDTETEKDETDKETDKEAEKAT